MPESRGRPSDRQPRSKEASAERKPVPVSPPRRSLAQATLRFLSRALRVILACAIRPRIAARWCLLLDLEEPVEKHQDDSKHIFSDCNADERRISGL